MSGFVMGFFVIQVMGGLYQMGTLVTANASFSTARASRLSDYVVFSHATLGLVAAGLWLGQLLTGDDGYAWATLVVVLLSVVGGMAMYLKTEREPETVDRPALDPADVRVAEKQIPAAIQLAHGAGAALLVLCILIVAL